MRLCLWWYWTTSYLQPNILAVWQGYCCIVTWYCWKIRTLHEFLWHPCAGAMLIFSLSFQFCYMFCFREHAQKILHIYGENFITSNAAFTCGGNLLLLFQPHPLPPTLPRCSPRWMQQALAGCILCQETTGSTAALRIVCITAVMLHCHWILLKIWSMSGVLMTSWCRGHAIFLIIVSILIYVFPLQRHLDNTTPQFLKVF